MSDKLTVCRCAMYELILESYKFNSCAKKNKMRFPVKTSAELFLDVLSYLALFNVYHNICMLV